MGVGAALAANLLHCHDVRLQAGSYGAIRYGIARVVVGAALAAKWYDSYSDRITFLA